MVALVLNLGPEAKNSAFEYVYGERRYLMSIYNAVLSFSSCRKKLTERWPVWVGVNRMPGTNPQASVSYDVAQCLHQEHTQWLFSTLPKVKTGPCWQFVSARTFCEVFLFSVTLIKLFPLRVCLHSTLQNLATPSSDMSWSHSSRRHPDLLISVFKQ